MTLELINARSHTDKQNERLCFVEFLTVALLGYCVVRSSTHCLRLQELFRDLLWQVDNESRSLSRVR